MLEISETFRSLQGEGPLMGRPAFFIRLAGCIEPICPWCDTPEGLVAGVPTSVEELLGRTDPSRDRLAIITGGEPFRQWGHSLKELETSLMDRLITVQYETSGKLAIPGETEGDIVCSPKFLEGQWQFAQENFDRMSRVAAFKFVVTDNGSALCDFVYTHSIPHEKVWIMGCGASRQEQLARAEELWQFSVDHGFNYSPRLHILTFDTRRSI